MHSSTITYFTLNYLLHTQNEKYENKKLIFDYFSNICPENQGFVQIWQEYWVLYMKKYVTLWQCLA